MTVERITAMVAAGESEMLKFKTTTSTEQRWENQPADGWAVKDLDEAEIRRTVDEGIRRGRLGDPGTRETTELLRGLGLFRDGILWRAAVVLFGDAGRIECEMPQCLLRVARFRGLDRTEFLDNRQFHGNAFALLKAAERFLRDMLPIAGRVEEPRFERIDEPRYPTLAMREALANALCHRDYSIGGGSVGIAVYDDRLEITSPGVLHFGLTPEKLFTPHEPLPWNPLIARTFYRRGIIEEWGRGTIKMAELTAAAGLPPPEIEDACGCVTVRFRHDRRLPSGPRLKHYLTEQQQAILTLLDQADQALALRDIHARLEPGADLRRVREDLLNLKEKGLIVPSGHGRGARWRQS